MENMMANDIREQPKTILLWLKSRLLTRKTPENGHEENQGASRKGAATASLWGPTGRGGHHSQAVAPYVPSFFQFSSVTSSRISLAYYGICHGMVVLGHFQPLLIASLIYKASKHLLLIYFRLIQLILYTHLKEAKPKCNRRNGGENHIIKHANPVK